MKQSFYRFFYRLASRLSDITGGARPFVRWKVALAAVIIGFTSLSCRPWNDTQTTCYDRAEPTCYDPVPTCYITPEEPCPEDDGTGGQSAGCDDTILPEEARDEPSGGVQ